MSSDRTSNGSPRRTIPKKLAVPCEGDDRPDRRLNVLCDDHLPLPVHTTLQLHPRVNVWLDLRGLLAGRQVGAPVVAPGAAAVRIGRTRRGGRFRVRHERHFMNDPGNCGGCGIRCCIGACFQGACFCDGVGLTCCVTDRRGADGCYIQNVPTDLATDPCHCGGCDTVCPAGTTCSNATCVAVDGGGGCQ
jgi:hypothetical protein